MTRRLLAKAFGKADTAVRLQSRPGELYKLQGADAKLAAASSLRQHTTHLDLGSVSLYALTPYY
jgi:hypothetical protein